MNDKYVIVGGKKLNGIVNVQKSKNALLPIIASSVLTESIIELKSVPKLSDIDNMLQIIEQLGSKIVRKGKSVYIDNSNINKTTIDAELSKKIRASIFLLGPMLAKHKKICISYPGGCNIGNRPINLHLEGLKGLGVEIRDYHSLIVCNGENMRANTIHLDFPSVGATENIMMASVFLKGTTTIINSAREVEIIDLQNFLNKLGCKISGAGTSQITIEGVKKLHGGSYSAMGDRIVAGTFLIAGAMCGGEITVKGVSPNSVLSLLTKLNMSGCEITTKCNSIYLKSTGHLNSIDLIETRVYPGFPTDLQAQIMSMQTISKGVSVIVENIFENRYKHVQELNKMGANIYIKDKVAVVRGVDCLKGAPVEASDLRGGASLILAGLVAKGYTTIENIEHIKRGYENIDSTLLTLGADIK